MAFRTFSRSRLRFPSRAGGFRRRNRLNWQKADRPRRWQMGNFFTTLTVVDTNVSDTTFNTAILLARTMNFGDNATSQGRALSERLRRVDIGGVVLSAGIFRTQSTDAADIGATAMPFVQYTLLVDRLTTTGSPVAAATAQWGRSQLPALQVSATRPSTTEEDVDFPTRVLWRRTDPIQEKFVVLDGSVEGNIYFTDLPRTLPGSIQLNKKLKLPLDDEHGLFFSFSLINPADYAGGVDVSYRLWLAGSIYYRVAS